MRTSPSLLIALMLVHTSVFAAEGFDPKTEKPIADIIQENPNAIPLDSRDPTKDIPGLFRDCKDNPKREPGLFNIQRTLGGTSFQGIPTLERICRKVRI